MNRILHLPLWILSSLILVSVHAAESVPAAAFTARAKQTRERIDILFRHHNDAPTTPPGPNQNPFRTAADVPAPAISSSADQPGESVQSSFPTSDDVLLKQAVATLKIGGTVVIGGQINVSINQETYREGGSIIARIQGTPVYLHVRRITSNSVTFALNDSELTQPF
jgi:hypothetical protein